MGSISTMLCVILLATLLGAACIGMGVVIGWFSHTSNNECNVCKTRTICNGPCLGPDVPGKIIEDGEDYITQRIIDAIDGTRIRAYLQ